MFSPLGTKRGGENLILRLVRGASSVTPVVRDTEKFMQEHVTSKT